MIQLDKSQAINKVAFYPEVPVSASVVGIRVHFSQDINLNTGSFDGFIDEKLNWVVADISGSVIPNPSGLYTLNIFGTSVESLIWNLVNETWETVNSQWQVGQGLVPGQQIATERAYISGSNESSLVVYLSPGQAGFYTTYQN
jgi:hypothetical protein